MESPIRNYPRLEPRLEALQPSATLAINERSALLEQSGGHVYRLGLGQSPFPVPAPVQAALRANVHQKDYLPVQGLPALRDAIAEWHRRHNKLTVPGEQVLVGPGSKELLFLLQLVTRARLVLPNPSWVSYGPQARILDKRYDWIQTTLADRWLIHPEQLEALCRHSPQTHRILVLNYPNNPTGATYSADQLRRLAIVARRYHVLVISDEIYGALNFEGAHRSIFEFYPEGTILTSGLSKWCGAGGWRLGYAIIPRALDHLRRGLCAVASESFTSVSAPIQWASVRAFQDCPEIDQYVQHSRSLMGALTVEITKRLHGAGADTLPALGGFYLMPDFSRHRVALSKRGIDTSDQLAEALLAERRVACLPGTCFGRSPSELTLRLSCVNFDGTAALAYLQTRSPGKLTGQDLLITSSATLEATDRLCEWVNP